MPGELSAPENGGRIPSDIPEDGRMTDQKVIVGTPSNMQPRRYKCAEGFVSRKADWGGAFAASLRLIIDRTQPR